MSAPANIEEELEKLSTFDLPHHQIHHQAFRHKYHTKQQKSGSRQELEDYDEYCQIWKASRRKKELELEQAKE